MEKKKAKITAIPRLKKDCIEADVQVEVEVEVGG